MIKLLKLAIILCLLPSFAYPKDISQAEIDSIVTNVMKVMKVPGVAVGVIYKGKIIHSKGYGVRSLNNGGAVNEDTYFGIASNSKGFTATALGILVDDGKISWDDKVSDILPEFKLSDPWLTDHFTIADLLSHSTGLPLGSGDLMWWPDANYQPDEIISKMRFLKPNREFRTSYEYNNMPFIVAGAIIPAVTGLSYQDFLQKRIFDPLGMERCTANVPEMANDDNIAAPHAVLDDKLTQIKRYLTIDQVPGSIAAAGIQCSINDLLKWQLMHFKGGGDIISVKTHGQLWQVRTPLPVSETQIMQDKIHFRGYGLGYSLNDYHGVKVISHGGALIGMYSHLTMVPEIGFAVAIVTNQQSGAALTAIKNQILNFVMDIKNPATVEEIFARDQQAKKQEVKRLKNLKGRTLPALNDEAYMGQYKDDWWEDVEISQKEDALYFTSRRSPSLRGKLEHFEENTFIVRWDDRTHEADAFVMFNTGKNGSIESFTMKAISPRTDFSYDFHHVSMIKQ